MKDNTIKTGIIIVVILLILTGVYFLLKNLTKDDELQYEEFLKNYEVNEYIATYISDEHMARIYLNEFVDMMFYDAEAAYNLLDENYRSKKFGNLTNFKNYINSLSTTSFSLDRYYKKESDGYIIFGVYDKNNNFFAFKTKGVMQYSVYLDDYTVEIW